MFLVMASLPVFGQIQIQESGKTKSVAQTEKEASYIQWYDDGYYFKIADYKCSKYRLTGDKFILKIFLGKNANEIKESGAILQQWFDNAKNDEYIYVTNPDGQKVCIYKFNLNMYASYGTEMNCKATRIQFGADMTNALLGGGYTSKKERDELMANVEFGEYVLTGLCSFKKDFIKSINNFKEPGLVTIEYRQKVGEQVAKVKKEARGNEINESVSMQNYNIVVRELMQSDKEKDWTILAHVNGVILEVMKSKSKINIQELESALTENEDVQGKIEVFETYYSQL